MVSEMEQGQSLKRSLGPVALTSLGVGAIIGTGIFVLVGQSCSRSSGTGDYAVLCGCWISLRFCSALLCGVRFDGTCSRLSLQLRVCNSW